MIAKYISIDIGASSGRVFIVSMDGEKIKIEELYRFSNEIININDKLYWEFEKLLKNVKLGIQKSFLKYPNIKSIGIDTWGVDYGCLGEDGKLLENPRCYRDSRFFFSTKGIS